MISVIIPAYNVEKYIGACLDSVLAQEGVDLEIIVVDDESTDSTRDIIRRYARQHSCIKALYSRHGGLSAVRNRGLQECCGNWITMVDGDDVLVPGALKCMRDCATSENTDIVMGAYKIFTDICNVTQSDIISHVKHLTGKQAAEIMLYKSKYTSSAHSSAWGKLYRRQMWDVLRFKEGILYEDLEVIPRLIAGAKRVAVIKDVVYGYRYNTGSILHVFTPKRLDVLDVTESLEKYFADDSELYKAARSRHFSAAFNLWLLMVANDAVIPEKAAECRRVVRRLAVSQLFGRKVRLKNRIGALLQYFPFIFKSTYLCKKLLAK